MFPEAKTLLAATAEANNHNAKDTGLRSYKVLMDHVVGPTGRFVPTDELELLHRNAMKSAIKAFKEMANIGSEGEKQRYLLQLRKAIDVRRYYFQKVNIDLHFSNDIRDIYSYNSLLNGNFYSNVSTL